VSQLQSKSVSNILDIGCGQAGLLNAASRRWSKAKLIGYDIDPLNYSINCNKLNLQYGDGLDPDLSKKILDTFGSVDVSVSNPPYLNVDYNKAVKKILRQAGLYDAIPAKLKVIPAELVFIAQNLLVLKKGGELGIILPASLVSGEKWKGVREYLLESYIISNSIQFPTTAFKKTETSTFALCLKNKNKKNKYTITLNDNLFSKTIKIDKTAAIKRMDFSYYDFKSQDDKLKTKVTLTSLFRGNRTDKDLREFNCKYLHTSDLKNIFQTLDLKSNFSLDNTKCATKGDLVVSRVGSRCVGKSAFIKSGTIPISDCLFVIRSNEIDSLVNFMKSGDFYNKTKHSALGVGAKYITMNLLREMINDNDV
jgi:type I restriction enzyme M protein